MEKKLPGVFANKIDKKINNNKTVYYGEKDRENVSLGSLHKDKEMPVDIRRKIGEIFKSVNYIYKIDVDITLPTGTITKKIIGYNERDVITFDNERIPIHDIIDIQIKK